MSLILFLNLKSIISSNEDSDDCNNDEAKSLSKLDEDDIEDKSSDENENNDDGIDNLDETSNWNDFDIETLNFDKFIKDHQQAKSSEPSTSNFPQKPQKSMNLNKRKLEQDTDPNELKAKRRVNLFL